MTIKKLKLRLVGRIFLVCTEKVHFTFEKNIYQQKDDCYGISTRSSVGRNGTFRINTYATIREIYKTLEKV